MAEPDKKVELLRKQLLLALMGEGGEADTAMRFARRLVSKEKNLAFAIFESARVQSSEPPDAELARKIREAEDEKNEWMSLQADLKNIIAKLNPLTSRGSFIAVDVAELLADGIVKIHESLNEVESMEAAGMGFFRTVAVTLFGGKDKREAKAKLLDMDAIIAMLRATLDEVGNVVNMSNIIEAALVDKSSDLKKREDSLSRRIKKEREELLSSVEAEKSKLDQEIAAKRKELEGLDKRRKDLNSKIASKEARLREADIALAPYEKVEGIANSLSEFQDKIAASVGSFELAAKAANASIEATKQGITNPNQEVENIANMLRVLGRVFFDDKVSESLHRGSRLEANRLARLWKEVDETYINFLADIIR